MKKSLIILLFLFTFIFASEPYTPKRGTAERAAIMDALRIEVKKYHNIDVLFVVRTLKLKDGWAWAITAPMSKDGANHYEDIVALLHKENNTWSVAELVCMEVETPGCIDDPNFLNGLQERFLDVPKEIVSFGGKQ